MLNFENNEINRINEFLGLLNTNFSSIDYVSKDNVFYPTKELNMDYELLSYLLTHHQGMHDIILDCNKKTAHVDMYTVRHGAHNKVDIKFNAKNDYATANIEGTSYSSVFFQRYLKDLTSRTYQNYQNTELIYIPSFGVYKVSSMLINSDATFRLIKLKPNDCYHQFCINWLNIDEHLSYKISLEFEDGVMVKPNTITIPEKMKQDINLYVHEINKLFSEISDDEGHRHYDNSLLTVVFDYDQFDTLKMDIHGRYLFYFSSRPDGQEVFLNYIKEHTDIFYHPIFNKLIEMITGVKIDPLIDDFESPEGLENYLKTIEMISI